MFVIIQVKMWGIFRDPWPTNRMEVMYPPAQPTFDAVKEAIAELEQCHPEDLGTLSEAVNVDVLTALDEAASEDEPGPPRTVTFRYCGYLIRADTRRTLQIEK